MTARFWSIVAALLLAVFLAASAPAAARAAHAAPEGEEIPKGGAEKDIFAPRLDLTIWTIVVFVVLLLVLRKYAWTPMLQGLQVRELRIRGALDEAKQAREEAERLRGQLDEQMRKANEQAREILEEARKAAERTTAEMTAEAHKKIQAEHERLQREMTLQYDQARREIQAQVAQLATLVASKVIRRQVNHDDHRQLVDEALAELRQAGNGRKETAVV